MPEITTLIYAPYYKPIDSKAFRTRVVSMLDFYVYPIPSVSALFGGITYDKLDLGLAYRPSHSDLTVDKISTSISTPTVNKNVVEASTATIRGV